MRSRLDMVRATLYVLFAAAAPWDAFLFVPGLNIRLTWLLTLAVIALEFADYLHTRHVGVRFELLWPSCALLILALPPMRAVPAQGAAAILLGMAAARSAGPALARDVVAALALSVGALAVYTVIFFFFQFLAPAQSPPPSAYSLETGILAPFGHTITECALILFVGLAAAASRFLRNDSAATFPRRMLLALALPLFVALVCLLSFSLGAVGRWRPPDHFASKATALAALIGGWLLARILAKSFIHWREMRYTISEDTMHILAGLAFFALLFPLEFRFFWGFLAGIAAGAAQAERRLAPLPPKWAFALAPVALLVSINISGVHPADKNNPRNYEVAAQQDFAGGQYARLQSRMDYFETSWPDERRTHLWRARAALANELLHEAAHEITIACRPADDARLLLPPPDSQEVDAFLIRLRDACSQSGIKTASLAHIQGLLGAGKFNHAEALLEQALEESADIALPEGLSTDLDTAAYGCPCSWPLRAAALNTVWTADLEQPAELKAMFPEDLSGAQWLRLLLSWGANVRTPPPEFPREALPLICIAKCHRSSIELACISADARLARTDSLTTAPVRYDPAAQYIALELAPRPINQQATWRGPESPSSDKWTISFETQETMVAAVELHNGITLTSQPPTKPLPAPQTPIICIWL